MNPYQIIVDILDKPNVPKHYRQLKEYYSNCSMQNEALAVDYLLEKKFGKNNETSDDSFDNSK